MNIALRLCSLLFAAGIGVTAAPGREWLIHDRERPSPVAINPGVSSTQHQPGSPPSDAVVLFSGKDLTSWVGKNGEPAKWLMNDGSLILVPGSGDLRTLQSFGDCQLHVEWTVPVQSDQRSGNSGVLFGNGRYEIQVLDSYGKATYADGAAASVYGQHPPLVNASLAPGQWQVFDIVWTAPRFDLAGKLRSKARMTVFHNGVLVQNNVELSGPTTWINQLAYEAHAERLPITLQDHGSPVHFRNVWVRELGSHRHPEFLLPDATLDSYVGDYGTGQWGSVRIRRLQEGLLSLALGDAEVVLHAASQTHFYAKTADVQCRFDFSGENKKVLVTVGVDFNQATVMERRDP